MELLTRLFAPRRRKTRQEVAGRAVDVAQQVLSDIGIDRFLNGTILLDRQFRLRFFSSTPPTSRSALAAIAVRDLPEALILRAYVDDAGLDAAAVRRHAPMLADGLMRELLVRAPALRELPLTDAQRDRRLSVR